MLTTLLDDGFGESTSPVNLTIGGKPCLNANWEASHPDTGRPYLQCNPALDVAGAKDLKLYVALTEHLYGVTSDLEYNTSTSFSICMAGKTNIRTGITKKYYGRPCNVVGSNVPNVSFSNRAPCVSEKSGKGKYSKRRSGTRMEHCS